MQSSPKGAKLDIAIYRVIGVDVTMSLDSVLQEPIKGRSAKSYNSKKSLVQ